ncbi:hypothetical protein MUO79_10445 [Candidatus Bathyarchaeota archaeon]|nr:hypothetical protein [Candidatus Bathyarchaeota archaeon]
MITIEGIKVNAKIIPEKQLILTWKTLTNEPFPKVKAFQLNDSDFCRVIHIRRCEEDERREMEEWGRVLSTKGTNACVLTADASADVDYVILIRENPYHSLREIIRHELSHIARGNL